MNENWVEVMNHYFMQKKAACEKQRQRCRADLRDDEAVFAQIRGNVYDAFAAVFSAALRQGAKDEEKARQFFQDKLAQIPRNWQTALDQARQHGDDTRALLEQIKLETAQEIETMFRSVTEVETP